MIIKGTNLLVKKIKVKYNGIIDFQSEYSDLMNEGLVEQVGEEINDKDLTVGRHIYFRGFEAVDIDNTDLCIVNQSSILAIEA